MNSRQSPRFSTNATWNTLDDDRDPAMLAEGLSLLDTQAVPISKLQAAPAKRRTLDDMRALSNHIKNMAKLRGG